MPKIPKHLRNAVWDAFMGPNNERGICFCCGNHERPIYNDCYHAGHIVSSANGGIT